MKNSRNVSPLYQVWMLAYLSFWAWHAFFVINYCNKELYIILWNITKYKYSRHLILWRTCLGFNLKNKYLQLTLDWSECLLPAVEISKGH